MSDKEQYQPYDRPHMTSRQKITSLILSGIRMDANRKLLKNWGDWFNECDRMLALITFKDEGEE